LSFFRSQGLEGAGMGHLEGVRYLKLLPLTILALT